MSTNSQILSKHIPVSAASYIQSLVDPQRELACIPDDNLQNFCMKSQTTTENIVVGPSGAGMFVIYPNNPGSVIGTHYTFDPVTQDYVAAGVLSIAQNMRKSYNSCRKAAQMLTFQSSTLPSGIFALNGTMNAITYYGHLSEIDSYDYSKLLAVTQDASLKLANVLIGDGIATFMLPEACNTPFVRLDDPSPTTLEEGSGSHANHHSAPLSRITSHDLYRDPTPFVSTQNYNTVLSGSFNCDGNGYTKVSLFIRVKGTFTQFVTDQQVYSQAVVDFLGPTGLIIHTEACEEQLNLAIGSVLYDTANTLSFESMVARHVDSSSDYPQFTAIRITYKLRSVFLPDVQFSTLGIQVQTSVTGGLADAPNGPLSPVTIVAYTGVAPTSVITVSGYTNYELIPNPSLAKDVTTFKRSPEPDEAHLLQQILSHRRELGLNNAVKLTDLAELRARIGAITSPRPDEAHAFSMGSLWSKIRKGIRFAAPLIQAGVGAYAPQMLPVSGALLSKAASGRPVGLRLAADNGSMRITRKPMFDSDDDDETFLKSFAMDDETARTLNMMPAFTTGNGKHLSKLTTMLERDPSSNAVISVSRTLAGTSLTLNAAPGVIFPTLLVDASLSKINGVQMYIAVFVNSLSFAAFQALQGGGYIDPTVFNHSGMTRALILGAAHTPEGLTSPSPTDILLLPIESSVGNTVLLATAKSPKVSGRSLETALAVLATWDGHGIFPYIPTGAISVKRTKQGMYINVLASVFFEVKKAAFMSSSFNTRKLVGNDSFSDPPVKTITQLIMLAGSGDSRHLLQKYPTHTQEPGVSDYALAMDARTPTPPGAHYAFAMDDESSVNWPGTAFAKSIALHGDDGVMTAHNLFNPALHDLMLNSGVSAEELLYTAAVASMHAEGVSDLSLFAAHMARAMFTHKEFRSDMRAPVAAGNGQRMILSALQTLAPVEFRAAPKNVPSAMMATDQLFSAKTALAKFDKRNKADAPPYVTRDWYIANLHKFPTPIQNEFFQTFGTTPPTGDAATVDAAIARLLETEPHRIRFTKETRAKDKASRRPSLSAEDAKAALLKILPRDHDQAMLEKGLDLITNMGLKAGPSDSEVRTIRSHLGLQVKSANTGTKKTKRKFAMLDGF